MHDLKQVRFHLHTKALSYMCLLYVFLLPLTINCESILTPSDNANEGDKKPIEVATQNGSSWQKITTSGTNGNDVDQVKGCVNELAKAKATPYLEKTLGNVTAALELFDKDKDGSLNLGEFECLCHVLFTSGMSNLESKGLEKMFASFDKNLDSKIDNSEFSQCHTNWVMKILSPVSAFLVIDVQNDFIIGSLAARNAPAKQEGLEVIPPINWMLDNVKFDKVYYSQDWHPSNHISFVDNVRLRKLDRISHIQSADDAKVLDTVVFRLDDANSTVVEQRLWPRHCVQNTWGAQLHDQLKVVNGSGIIYKGINSDIDSYSALFDNNRASSTDLVKLLEHGGVTDVYVAGLALDFCVGETAKDSISLGYRTIVVEDAVRGIDLNGMQDMRKTIKAAHGIFVNSNQVNYMVNGVDRRAELGYHLALTIQSKPRRSRCVQN